MVQKQLFKKKFMEGFMPQASYTKRVVCSIDFLETF